MYAYQYKNIDKAGIEKCARELQKKYWKWYSSCTKGANPFAVTLPSNLIEFVGIQYEEIPNLTQWGKKYNAAIAGTLDRQQKLIAVSTDISHPCQRFTAGHELGHWVLHEKLVMHRDVPGTMDKIEGISKEELEANYFSACILMPRGLVRQAFKGRFFEIPFTADEKAAFHLGVPTDEFNNFMFPSNIEREFVLAKTTKYGDAPSFQSLKDTFKVSTMAMAIRLEELGYVKYP